MGCVEIDKQIRAVLSLGVFLYLFFFFSFLPLVATESVPHSTPATSRRSFLRLLVLLPHVLPVLLPFRVPPVPVALLAPSVLVVPAAFRHPLRLQPLYLRCGDD